MSSKKTTLSQRIETLEGKIELRPTHIQSVGYYLTMIGILSGIFYFVFTNVLDVKLKSQAEVLKAYTKTVVTEAVRAHEDRDYVKWEQKKESILAEVFAKLKNGYGRK